MRLSRLHAYGVVALTAPSIARAAGAADSEPVRVEVRAPAGCSDEGAFFAQVRARTTHVRRAANASEAVGHTLLVSLERAPGAVKGELVVVDATGGATRRALSGETCEAVVSGLAWVAARAIDPEASFAPSKGVEVASAEPVTPAPMAPLFPCAAVAVVSTPAPEEPPPPPEPSPPARWHVTVGADAFALGVGPPGPILDIGVFGELASGSSSVLSPAFRLAVHHTTEADVTTVQTSGAFVWTFARAEACPWRFDLVGALTLRACGILDAGVLSASGGGGTGFQAGSQLRPWFTAGELARIEWALAGPLRVEAQGGLTLPLVRETFAFDATATVYQAPVVLGFASLGLGVRFP
jgi:hypothetical protein